MANHNDHQFESPEALKKRFLSQNVQLARAKNDLVAELESLKEATSDLIRENCKLRQQVIELQSPSARREKARVVRETRSVEATKKQLEEKTTQLKELVKGLEWDVLRSAEGKLAIRLRASLCPGEKARMIEESVYIVKTKLEDKVAELDGVVRGMGQGVERSPANHRKAAARQPWGRWALNRQPRLGEMGGGQMPAISEEPPASSTHDAGPVRKRDRAKALFRGVLKKPVRVKKLVTDVGFTFSRASGKPIELALPTAEAENTTAATTKNGQGKQPIGDHLTGNRERKSIRGTKGGGPMMKMDGGDERRQFVVEVGGEASLFHGVGGRVDNENAVENVAGSIEVVVDKSCIGSAGGM